MWAMVRQAGKRWQTRPSGKPLARAAVTRRQSDWIGAYRMAVKGIAERPDAPTGTVIYLIKDVWTTRNGSWEPSSEPGSIPQWARDAWLSVDFLEAGADHHLFGAVLGLDGKLIPAQEICFWSDGFAQLGNPGYSGYLREKSKELSRWANIVLFGGSSFVPERGESGPWCWAPPGRAEVMTGGGLPANHHISTFVVWQMVADDGPPLPEPPVTPEPPAPPVTPEPPVTPAPSITRRQGRWIEPLRGAVRTLAERPSLPAGDIVYLIKDLFTTRDGSWEVAEQMGAVDQWARESYLKPWGAPDYFDDAGADHHLFARVLNPDGSPIPEAEILYWSDGFHQLGNPNYTGYVSRLTKSQSGWANIPMWGANYYPDEGQQGPWCWAPAGPAEVFVGGGMPANHHVSFFVVWQAVKRSAVEPLPSGFNVYVPWVGVGGSAPNNLPLPPGYAQANALAAERLALQEVRAAAWRLAGAATGQSSPLANYARGAGLGLPVTQQFSVAGYVAQGFAGGIVFARAAAPTAIGHIAW